MAGKDPTKIAAKWRRNLSNAQTDMEDGARRVEVAPGQLAVKQKDKMRANLLEAIDSGRWERRTLAVSREDWIDDYVKKGIPRIASGATAGEPKMAEYMREALPVIEALQSKINALPSQTLDDSLQRVRVMMEGMRDFGRKR